METLRFDAAAGELTLHTGVAGSAAKMGHRLVMEVADWQAEVQLDSGQVQSVHLVAQLPSLRVRSGDGGVKPLSEGDKQTIAGNAQRALDASKFPTVEFRSSQQIAVPTAAGQYALRGVLAIHGRERPVTATLIVEQSDAGWQVRTTVAVLQSDYGIKAFSTMLGQLRVADEVGVQFQVAIPA